MSIKVQTSEWLNERGNRSYTSNFVYPKTATDNQDLHIVCGTVGSGVMYRGDQVAEQICKSLAAYIDTNAANYDPEADAQAELLTAALAYTEAQLTEYNVLHPECMGIAGTLACVHFTDNGAIVGWVGDTRAVLIRNGVLVRQTTDHATKYPYDDFSLHPRRTINRMVEGAEKPASMDVEWWADLQVGDIIAISTYAVSRPLEQGFLGDAWARDTMRDSLKLACDAHARDNYAMTALRLHEVAVAEVALAVAAPIGTALANTGDRIADLSAAAENEEEPTLDTETSGDIVADIEEPTLDTETSGDIVADTEEPTLDSETSGDVVADTEEPTLDTETSGDVVANTEEPTLDTETSGDVVVEVPTIETPKTVIGNYKYEDDDEEKAGTGFIWSPTATPPESNPITQHTPATPIIDFTTTKQPNMDNETPKTDTTAHITVEQQPASRIGRWGWAIAACLMGVALVAWLASMIFGDKTNTANQQFLANLKSDLYTRSSAKDSLEVYNDYISKAASAKMPTEEIDKLKGMAGALAARVNAEPDSTAAALADTNNGLVNDATGAPTEATDHAKSPAESAKLTPTEAGHKTVKTTTPTTKTEESHATEGVAAAEGAKPAANAPKSNHNGMAARMKSKHTTNENIKGASGNKLPAVKPDIWKSFDKTWAESEGFRVVQKGDKFGWYKADGTPFIAPIYEECGSFKNGMAAVKKGGKWGFTNAKGKLIVPYKYASVTQYGNKCADLAQVSDGKKLLFVDKNGKEVAGCQ